MAQECGFFNAQLVGEEYDRVYLAEQFAAYFASFIGNGVFGKSMQQLEVVAQSSPNMSVKVLSGQAWINGWWYRNSDEYTINLDVADGVLSRIDRIVIRWGNQERDVWLDVIKGTPSSKPVAPPIVRNADYYDLGSALVLIEKGAIRITQAQITDTRLDNSVCGLVTGVVDQIDTTDLYNQFEQYFKEFKEKYEKDYADWTAAQKAAYLAWIKQQQAEYDAWVKVKQEDYDTWTADKMEEYVTWVADRQEAYDTWIAAREQEFLAWVTTNESAFENWTNKKREDYEKFVEQQTGEYVEWTTEQEQKFIEWVAAQTSTYEDWTEEQRKQYEEWIAQQKVNFRDWYNTHVNAWTTEFEEWFESIKDKLSGDIAGKLQLQIDQQSSLIENLHSMLFDGEVKRVMMTSDGKYLKTSNGDYILFTTPIAGGIQSQINTLNKAVGSIMDMLRDRNMQFPMVTSNSRLHLRTSDGKYLLFNQPLCDKKKGE